MADDDILLCERPLAGCALLTLNRPAVMNALSVALRRALVAEIDRLGADPSVRVLVLTGAGRAFCAGLDLAELGELGASGLGADAPADTDVVGALERFAAPVIVAVNGAAVTGGFELALAGDLMVASTRARFADTHARVGVMPGWGLSQRLPRRIGVARAKELSLTGNFLDAPTALAWGLVNRVVAPDELLPSVLALAADMLTALPPMLPAIKRVIDDGFALPFGEALELERRRAAVANAAIAADALAARREGVIARGRRQAGAPSADAPAREHD